MDGWIGYSNAWMDMDAQLLVTKKKKKKIKPSSTAQLIRFLTVKCSNIRFGTDVRIYG